MRRLLYSVVALLVVLTIAGIFFKEKGIAPSYQSSSSSVSIAASSHAMSSAAATACAKGTVIALVFYSKTDFEKAEFKNPVTVERCVQHSLHMEDIALRLLFAGPTAAEKKEGALGSADLSSLLALYLGVSVKNGTATINFKKDALKILNSAAARQMMVKSPIEATLKQLPDIRTVNYSIEGKLFTEWDA